MTLRPAKAELVQQSTFVISECPPSSHRELALISIAFVVDRVFDVVPDRGGLGGLRLIERALVAPYEKDYDAIAGEGPLR